MKSPHRSKKILEGLIETMKDAKLDHRMDIQEMNYIENMIGKLQEEYKLVTGHYYHREQDLILKFPQDSPRFPLR